MNPTPSPGGFSTRLQLQQLSATSLPGLLEVAIIDLLEVAIIGMLELAIIGLLEVAIIDMLEVGIIDMLEVGIIDMPSFSSVRDIYAALKGCRRPCYGEAVRHI